MDDYFKPISAHIQGDVDFDAIASISESKPNLISLGSDDLIIWRNIATDEHGTKELEMDHGFTRIALHPDGDHFIVGGFSKKIFEFQLSTFGEKEPELIHECLGNILHLKYSSSGDYISAATEEQKTIIINRMSNKKTKCRPGHQNKILNTFFSQDEKYIASIGQDCMTLIYELTSAEPLEVYRTKFCSQLPSQFLSISGCFTKSLERTKAFLPGLNDLQEIEQINNRWQLKKTSIAHSSPIITCECLNDRVLATSCSQDICIWAINGYEKLIVLEAFPLLKMVSIGSTLIGSRNDGSLYLYNRPFPKPSIQNSEGGMDEESRINFQEEDNEGLRESEEEEESQEKHIQYITSKKTKADKIIQVYPQGALYRSTEYFDDHRFLHVNHHGYIVESREVDELTISVEYQHRSQDFTKNQVKNILRNKEKDRQYKYFAMNSEVVVYASESEYGVKIDQFTSWERTWADIQGVALGGNWFAVSNFSEIKFFDLSGNQIKSICFDRIIIAMEAYENLLAVVFHESIPIYTNQNLAMSIFTVSNFTVLPISKCHVPITPEYHLKWFGFSHEGMIFSQDSLGMLRAYSLQTNEWTAVTANTNIDQKKVWIVGVKNYELIYWKTTDSDPEPTVRPRFNLKSFPLILSTLEGELQNEGFQSYPSLLWQRHCLDHEKARWKLWGRHKKSRNPENINFELSETIMTEKQINERNIILDKKFLPIVQFHRKANQIVRAVNIVKSCIRSLQVMNDLMEYFDDEGLRTEAAIQLEGFIEEKKREIEYEAIQELKLKELKKKASVEIKPQKMNPMNPNYRKSVNNPLPPFNMSQSSQNSMILEDVTLKSQENSKFEPEESFDNPFAKKNSSSDHARKQLLNEHIEKFGVMKKKAEDKKKTK